MKPNVRRRPVVAQREAASADDRLVTCDASDRDCARSGVDQAAVGAGMGADAGRGQVIRRAQEAKPRKRRDDWRFIARVAEACEAEADRDLPPSGLGKLSLREQFVDEPAHHRNRSGEIDMNVRRCAIRLGKRSSVGVA